MMAWYPYGLLSSSFGSECFILWFFSSSLWFRFITFPTRPATIRIGNSREIVLSFCQVPLFSIYSDVRISHCDGNFLISTTPRYRNSILSWKTRSPQVNCICLSWPNIHNAKFVSRKTITVILWAGFEVCSYRKNVCFVLCTPCDNLCMISLIAPRTISLVQK